jgi:large subunit ribosomal protein L32
MPNPKRRHSSTRRDKRRTHYKATPQTVTICPETGVAHTRHTGYVVEGNLYYKGKMIVENYKKTTAEV